MAPTASLGGHLVRGVASIENEVLRYAQSDPMNALLTAPTNSLTNRHYFIAALSRRRRFVAAGGWLHWGDDSARLATPRGNPSNTATTELRRRADHAALPGRPQQDRWPDRRDCGRRPQ